MRRRATYGLRRQIIKDTSKKSSVGQRGLSAGDRLRLHEVQTSS